MFGTLKRLGWKRFSGWPSSGKPKIGKLAKKYKKVDTDKLDKFDGEIAATFYSKPDPR